jgi:phosphoribosylanthranilate isomerase
VTQTRIKICGITRPEDAREAVAGGADAIGMVFYPPSPRAISVVQAAEIVEAISPFVTVVALVVDKPADDINRILEQVPVDLIQFHGDESPAFCRQFARPWMKALRVREDTDIASACGAYGEGRAILLDAWQEGVPGGTGMRFDWGLVSRSLSRTQRTQCGGGRCHGKAGGGRCQQWRGVFAGYQGCRKNKAFYCGGQSRGSAGGWNNR